MTSYREMILRGQLAQANARAELAERLARETNIAARESFHIEQRLRCEARFWMSATFFTACALGGCLLAVFSPW